MHRHFTIAIRMALVTLLIFGVAYPLVVTGIAQVVFPRQANGSMIRQNGRVIGSELIGQQFTKPQYFHPRPSAAGNGYDATASGGSNLGPTNKQLISRIERDVKIAVKENPSLAGGKVPADMVTTSGSGLDPDMSIANAYAQAPRVARARGMSLNEIKQMIDAGTTNRQLGVLGEPRVNVLKLNMALDSYKVGKK